jgi:SCO1/SenC
MGYTTCKDICPAIVADMMWIEKHLPPAEADRVRFVFFSFDPAADTPERLRLYAEGHGLDPARWTLLTADDDAVRELAAALGVGYRPDEQGGFDHSAVISLIDPKGEIVFQQRGTQPSSEALLAKLTELFRGRTESAGKSASGLTDPSADDRFLALPARSSGRSQRAAQGRFDPFAARWANGRYLRILAIPGAITAGATGPARHPRSGSPQSASATHSSSHESSRATLQARRALVATRQVVAKPTSMAFNLHGCGRDSPQYAIRPRDGIRRDPCQCSLGPHGVECDRRREVCGLNVYL